ncbi:polygalacturonase QRT3-like [Carica papaya]|uniref:polygalacturonase QRT3-like n=1 Tax=Carica papaya TaxID=3649 RepID=UPI000B8D0CCF|nr:polygalacturonase QRT3-like [Carica papaya]
MMMIKIKFVYGDHYHHYNHHSELKEPLIHPMLASFPAPTPHSEPQQGSRPPRVYKVTSYGADPTGKSDSTEAFERAFADAIGGPDQGSLMEGITNLGGAQIDLQGGNYLIARSLRLSPHPVANLLIHGGTLTASKDFPADAFLIDLSSSSPKTGGYNYEFLTLKDLLLDCNYKGGGISVINSLRITIENCYITHFTSDGILVQGGHETYIRNSFLGQHITAGGDKGERDFTGTAIRLMGNDNAVTDVVIFSAAVGISIEGQANIISGVHCYNKATGFGGIGIHVKLPGLTQTRIVNCYLDYTGIVAEDPVQLLVSNSFFLGDAFILLKSVKGIASGVSIVDNMFSGSDRGIDIVQLDGAFGEVDQVIVERNSVRGMSLKSTVASSSVEGNGTSWLVDFNQLLLFPNRIRRVQYSFSTGGDSSFPNHALRNTSNNRVVIQSNLAVSATVFVTVNQLA